MEKPLRLELVARLQVTRLGSPPCKGQGRAHTQVSSEGTENGGGAQRWPQGDHGLDGPPLPPLPLLAGDRRATLWGRGATEDTGLGPGHQEGRPGGGEECQLRPGMISEPSGGQRSTLLVGSSQSGRAGAPLEYSLLEN